MVKKWGIGEGREKDEDIRIQKRNTWAALKRWARTRSSEDRIKLKQERKRLGEIRKDKKKEEWEKKRRKLKNSKNLTEFWETVRGFRTKRIRKGGNIEKEEWLRHFKKLLGEEKIGEEGGRGQKWKKI